MNKTELLSQLEGRLGSRRAAIDALESVLAEIQRAVAAGERVTLTGFGTFERVERAARTGRNPRTGAAIEIAASATPRFHPGASLRAAVAGTAVAGTAIAGIAVEGTKPASRAKARPTASGTAARATTRAKAAPAPASEVAKPSKAGKKSKAGKDEKPAKKASSGKKKKK